MDIHIGKEIQKILKQNRFKQTDLAEAINTVPSNIKRLLDRESIDSYQLLQISEALEFNFFDLYTEIYRYHIGVTLIGPNMEGNVALSKEEKKLQECQKEKEALEAKLKDDEQKWREIYESKDQLVNTQREYIDILKKKLEECEARLKEKEMKQ